MGHSQDHIPIGPVALAVALRLFSRAGAVVLICLLAARAWAAEGDRPLTLRRNVVRVSSAGTGENGFGFIVAERDGKLYIVTADHVVVAALIPLQQLALFSSLTRAKVIEPRFLNTKSTTISLCSWSSVRPASNGRKRA